MHPTPKRPGYYWAQWRKAVPGTRDGDELTPCDDWQPVQVFENALDDQSPEYLMVEVGGVEKAQSIENFVWGPALEAALRQPTPVTVKPDYEQGRRDVLNALMTLNPAVSAKLDEAHGRDNNNPDGKLPFDVVFWVASVAEQLGIEPKES